MSSIQQIPRSVQMRDVVFGGYIARQYLLVIDNAVEQTHKMICKCRLNWSVNWCGFFIFQTSLNLGDMLQGKNFFL